MAVSELISVEQYLHMSFEHDAEFVEGRIVERPAPVWEHSTLQGFLICELWRLCRPSGFFMVPEQRVKTCSDRFRVPDVCVVAEKPDEQSRGIVTRPPYLCVEILSPADTTSEMFEKIREYLNFGAQWVWMIDPASLSGQIHSQTDGVNVEDRIFLTDRFSVDLSKVEF